MIKSSRIRRAQHVARMGGERRCIQGFAGETLGKEPFGRPRRRCEDDIKKGLQKWDVEA